VQQRDQLIGATLGNYKILAPLGQGGMARVYRARQENLDREVAIKVLPPWYASDRSFVERFQLEARLIARLTHPNIVTVHDASEHHGHLYIVMQLVDGGTLKQRLDRLRTQGKTMDLNEATTIFQQIADALAYAHEQGIIHRDVKPVNVLMDRSGRPILSDFGIAKVLASSGEQLTRPGAGVGTPEYMSPEQCLGIQVDGRADIYALGVMLFEALTGRTPFVGNNYPTLAHSHLYEPPPPPSRFNATIPPAVERVILTALMKDPAQRYQKADELAAALVMATQTSTRLQALQTEQTSALYPCPQCGNLNKPQMRFCTTCGLVLNRCTACGHLNPVKHRFCTACGQGLSTARASFSNR
jgi:serine/threonine protein kinase